MVHAVKLIRGRGPGRSHRASAPPRRRAGAPPRRPRAPSKGVVVAFIAPALVLYSVLFLYPVVAALLNGLFEWRGIARGAFVGLANFRTLFTLQPYANQFVAALGNNLEFFVGTMVLQNGIGLLLALALHRTIRGRRFFQTVFSVPYLMSALVIGYAWSMILSPQFGILNQLLVNLGMDRRAWLGDPDLIMLIIIMINSWQWCGCSMLIFGAALGGIPAEHIEAAQLDGARYWRIVRSIQLPQMIPVISVVTILTVIGSFNLFDLVYAVGGSSGGPGGAADVLGTLFYRISFGNSLNATGLSGALSAVQLVLILAVTVLIQRGLRALSRRYS